MVYCKHNVIKHYLLHPFLCENVEHVESVVRVYGTICAIEKRVLLLSPSFMNFLMDSTKAISWSDVIKGLNASTLEPNNFEKATLMAQSYVLNCFDGMKQCIAWKTLNSPSTPTILNKFLCSLHTPKVTSALSTSRNIKKIVAFFHAFKQVLQIFCPIINL